MANTVVMRGVVFEDLSAQIRDNCIFGKEVESALQYGCEILSESEIDINLLPKNRYPFYIVNTYVRQMMLANADNDTEKAEECYMLARRFLKEREQQGSNVLIIKGALEVENAMRLMMLGKN
ncbi:MAG: hypothetical protein IJ730_06690, partial [Alphaproteobacteria bacterium]|nr:hypothetical protein [Alphaproteobacteria bacterium]